MCLTTAFEDSIRHPNLFGIGDSVFRETHARYLAVRAFDFAFWMGVIGQT